MSKEVNQWLGLNTCCSCGENLEKYPEHKVLTGCPKCNKSFIE